jgi:hypothetical protein
LGTQDTRRRQTKQKHNAICVGHHIRKRTQITDNIIITLYRGFVFRHDSWKFAHGALNNNHSFITISYTKLTERLKISNKQYIFKVNRTCRYYRQIETFNLTVFTSKAVRRSWVRTLSVSGRTKDYKIGICCFSTKHTALRSTYTDWFPRNQNNVSEWSNTSTRGLLIWLCFSYLHFSWL